jgi:hypothetical protein
MLKRYKSAALGLGALLVAGGIAFAAGNYSMYPIVGANSFCAATVSGAGGFNADGNVGGGGVTGQGQASSGSLCAQTVPAGPSGLTGNELIPADTQIGSGTNPQSVTIPSSLLGNATNRLIGGDMTTNLAQRLNTAKGVTALATLSPTAAVMTADRWWVIAPAAGVTVTMDTTASSAVIPGFNNTQALRVARTSSGAAGIVCVGQTLDKAASAPLIGNNAVFSFYEENGSTQSATNGNITVNIDYTSAADGTATQATLGFAGLNGSKFALGDAGQSGTPTNYTNAVAGSSPGYPTATVSSGIATIAASTTWTRYAVYAPIPVNVPGGTTPVTSVSVSICWTPTATTAVATDYIEINGMQLEAKPSTATPAMPAGVISPTAFDKRPAATEQVLQQYYWYFNYENQSAITTIASCTNTSVTVTNCLIPFPVPMRVTPALKYTAGFQAFTTTAYTAVNACSTLSASASYVTAPSPAGVLVNCTATTIPAAGTANNLTTLGTSSATGIISASAEP